MTIDPLTLGNVASRWCEVCTGMGGWDKYTYKPRFARKGDTTRDYMWCVWCSDRYVIRKVS